MSDAPHNAGSLPFNARAPDAWVQTLVAAGLKPGQARGAIKQLSQAWVRGDAPWEALFDAAPKALRKRGSGLIAAPTVLRLSERATADDQTSRLLFHTHDGHLIETVIIPSERGERGGRVTVCVSSQVGCGRRCVFCETGSLGLVRQLGADEIVAQLHQARLLWEAERGEAPSVSNVVFMGMGEPLDNLEAVLDAVAVMTDDLAYGLAARRITVSTVGVAPKIPEFLRRSRANLAVSLNAPDDARRTALMPVNKRCSMAELRDALIAGLPKGRDVLIEYILFDRVNDAIEDADALLTWLEGVRARVNLIPANPGPDPALRQPEPERVWAFHKHLLDRGVRAMVRHPHGRDVGGACGQLAGQRRTTLERLAHTRGGQGGVG